jgi:hypothetical protein
MKKLAALAGGIVALTLSALAAEHELDLSQIQAVKQPAGLYIVQIPTILAICWICSGALARKSRTGVATYLPFPFESIRLMTL